MQALDGKKTYLVAGSLAAATVAQQLGYLTPDQFMAAMGLLNALGLGTMRHSVAKVSPKAKKK